jgi:hypothetical protein
LNGLGWFRSWCRDVNSRVGLKIDVEAAIT